MHCRHGVGCCLQVTFYGLIRQSYRVVHSVCAHFPAGVFLETHELSSIEDSVGKKNDK